MTLYGTCSGNSMDEIVDVINQLHYKKNIFLHFSHEQKLLRVQTSFHHGKHEEENNPSKVLKNRVFFIVQTGFSPWQTTWLHQVCGKMLCLPKLILTIDGPTVMQREVLCAKEGGTN